MKHPITSALPWLLVVSTVVPQLTVSTPRRMGLTDQERAVLSMLSPSVDHQTGMPILRVDGNLLATNVGIGSSWPQTVDGTGNLIVGSRWGGSAIVGSNNVYHSSNGRLTGDGNLVSASDLVSGATGHNSVILGTFLEAYSGPAPLFGFQSYGATVHEAESTNGVTYYGGREPSVVVAP